MPARGRLAAVVVDGRGRCRIVVGDRGHSGVWGRFLGTTAEKVSRHAGTSVLIVR